MKRNTGLAAFLLIALVAMSACNSADVTKAAQIVKDASVVLQAAQKAEIAFHTNGLVSDSEHKAIQTGILKAAQSLDVANDAVLHAKDAATAKAAVKVAAQAARDLIVTVDVMKNQNAKAGLLAALGGLQIILASI